MAQASAAVALRRLRRPRDPSAALLSSRLHSCFLSSASASSPGALDRPKQPAGDGASTTSSACSSSPRSWFGSRRRQHAASTTRTRALHHAVSSDGSAATASSESAPASQSQLLHFIKSTFGSLEGQNHCWLNAVNGSWKTFNQQGIYLFLLYQSCETLESHSKLSAAFLRLKYLQQRYPYLNVFAMEYGSDISSLAAQSQAVCTIMKEYITFPILLSGKDFTNSNMTNGACYLLFEGSKDHVLFTKFDGDPELMIRGTEGFSTLSGEPSESVLESGVPWQKEEVVKEPYVGSFRNMLLYHPGCVSVDEDGDCIFISDSNHHRVIISNSDGMILDCIGSSPGFEDGEFESAKLLHPAASFYHSAEDCLYIVDSENHAVRKADFGRRFLETVYPVFHKKSSGIWSWIVDKLGLTKKDTSKREDALNIHDIDADSVVFPWHLLQISEDDLLVADRNFEAAWILRMSTGEKQDTVRGRAGAMELCQKMIDERCALLKDMHMNGSSSDKEHSNLLEKVRCNELVSSISRFQNCIVFCDTDGQRVLKHDLDTKNTSNIHFTNLGALGLPYWFVCPLERVSTWGHSIGQFQEHTRKVNVLPGRCNIKVSVDIPVDTEIAAPLVESCIWRQVRGSGAEISDSDGQDTTSEKVGIAQQWYDEIDNLAFSEAAEEPAAHKGDDKPTDEGHQDQKTVHFTCAINVSPGTCELVASVALYLKIDRTKADHRDQKAVIKRILQCDGCEEHAGIELLTQNCGDARDLVITKPVHLRLRLECADHPAGTTNKETISTESSLDIRISLE